MDFFLFFLVLIVPGFIGALVYNKTVCITNKLRFTAALLAALILDLISFTIMITGLYYLKGICTVSELLVEFGCLSFIRKYILLDTFIVIIVSILWYLICKFFNKKRDKPKELPKNKEM